MNRSYYTTKLRYLRKCTKTGKTFALPLKLDTDKVCLGENFVVCTTHRYLINIWWKISIAVVPSFTITLCTKALESRHRRILPCHRKTIHFSFFLFHWISICYSFCSWSEKERNWKKRYCSFLRVFLTCYLWRWWSLSDPSSWHFRKSHQLAKSRPIWDHMHRN